LLRLLAKLTRLAPRCPDEAGLLGEQHQPNRMDQPLAEKTPLTFVGPAFVMGVGVTLR
jgi:hypothetical protein